MSAALGLKAKPIANEPANDDSDISALINRLTAEVNQIAVDKTRAIQQITNENELGKLGFSSLKYYGAGKSVAEAAGKALGDDAAHEEPAPRAERGKNLLT